MKGTQGHSPPTDVPSTSAPSSRIPRKPTQEDEENQEEEEENVPTKKSAVASFPLSSSGQASHVDGAVEEACCPTIVKGATISPLFSPIAALPSRMTDDNSAADTNSMEEQLPQKGSPRQRKVTPGAVAVGIRQEVSEVTGRDSLHHTDSELRIEAHLAPDDAEVEARIAERMEDQITRQVEERLTSDIVIATEVKEDMSSTYCAWDKRIILVLVLLFFMAIGGVVGAIGYSVAEDKKKDTPIQTSPTSAPIKPVDDSLVHELKAWIVPTEQDLVRFSDPTSAQSQALRWLHSDPVTTSANRTSEAVLQRYVLAVLYFATSGSSWFWSYLSPEDVCTWNIGTFDTNKTGVFCDADGKTVDNIRLMDVNLRGTIPWELVLLTNLEFIDIGLNGISGSIPSRLHELTRLRVFWADFNDLTGPLPHSFASSVTYIDLTANALTGTIPGSWSTEMPGLQELWLSKNILTGTIPSELGLLSLGNFSFYANALSGSVDQIFCGATVLPRLKADCEEVECPCCMFCCYDDQLSCVEV